MSSLVTATSFICQYHHFFWSYEFSVTSDWPKIRKSEIQTSNICPTFADWVELWIPNLAEMFLMKCYWILQNPSATAFTVFELLRKNQQGGGSIKLLSLQPISRLKIYAVKIYAEKDLTEKMPDLGLYISFDEIIKIKYSIANSEENNEVFQFTSQSTILTLKMILLTEGTSFMAQNKLWYKELLQINTSLPIKSTEVLSNLKVIFPVYIYLKKLGKMPVCCLECKAI